MKPIPETNIITWTTQVWPGNPSLNLKCACKLFSLHKPIPVYVWGEETFHYTVSAGANSDYSYTGFCADCTNLEAAQLYVDSLYDQNKLFR